MKRPVLIILIYYIAGILTGRYLGNGIVPFVIMLCVILALIKANRDRALLAAPIFMLIGILMTSSSLKTNNYEAIADAKAEGVIYDISYSQSGRQRLDIRSDDKNIRIMTDKIYDANIGDVIVVKGMIDPPATPSNPGEFDDFLYMKMEGLEYRLYADSIYKTGSKDMPLRSFMYELREKINESIDNIYTKKDASIIKAVVTGDKSAISDETRTLYTSGGAVHILCVSGLHVSVIAAIIFIFVKKILRLNGMASLALSAVFLFAYMAFIGFTPSVIRAVIMAMLVVVAGEIGRKSDGLNNIYIAALAILLFDPLTLFNTGFMLSFLTVFGIVLSSRYIRFKGEGAYIKGILSASFFATVFSLPVTAYCFYNVSFAGILTNVIILPLTPIVVIFGILSAVMGVISVPLGVFFAGSAAVVLKIYDIVLKAVSAVPFLNIMTGRPGIAFCALYYVTIIIIITNLKNKRSIKAISGLCAAMLFISVISNKVFLKDVEIAFLDVGQGDCAVITDYNKNAFIIDTGGNWYYEDDENTGVRYIYPYLQYKGIKDIEVLFVSHPDIDHILGSIGLMDVCDISKIVLADFEYEKSEVYDRMIKKAEEKGIEILRVTAGDRISAGDIVFDCIYPYAGARGDDNAGSLVLKFTYDEFSALFMGDLGIAQEEIIIDNNIDIRSDILKVAHHGSKHSTGEKFVEAVDCDYAVISSGKNNIYDHPHDETMERLSDATKLVTADNGAIIIKTNGNDYTVKTMK